MPSILDTMAALADKRAMRTVNPDTHAPPIRLVALLVAGATMAACSENKAQVQDVRVAAAADLTAALHDLAATWQAQTGQHVAVTTGASGTLARQLEQQAPFDAFLSASRALAESTTQYGACDRTTLTDYARGHLVVVTAPGQEAVKSLQDLADPRFAHIAIANPDHAPYGMAARQALTTAGLWPALQPRVVVGENVRQALQMVRSGNAQAGLVARSLLQGQPAADVAGALYAPLVQTAVACTHGPNPASGKAFIAFVASPAGQAILRRHGLDPP